MDAAGMERAALLTAGPEAGPMALFFAGTRPERTAALIIADATARYLVADDYPIGVAPGTAELGDRRWRELLQVHDDLAARLVDRWGGRLVKSTGDGILATFDGPGRAVGCAAALREELRGLDIDLRAGLHAGEVELRDGDVGGIAVHIAARVMAAAGPGEVLVSRTVRDLVTGSETELQDGGDHHLKGVEGTWRLFAVGG